MARIELPDDPRARRLFDELEARYSRFVDGLPDSLRDVARAKSTYLGAEAEGEFEGIVSLNPVLAGAPWLFWEQFSSLEDEVFVNIAEAGACLVIASILLDHIVDGQANPLEQTALLHQAMRSHAFRLYQGVFPASSPFWERFHQLERDHVRGLGVEVEAQTHQAPVTWEMLEETAHGKVSPIIGTIAALATAADRADVLEPITLSLKHIAVASQLLDDIGDWEHDFEIGHQTHFLTEVRLRSNSQGAKAAIKQLRAIVQASWLDIDHLYAVIDQLDLSRMRLGTLGCSGWRRYISGYVTLAGDHQLRRTAYHLRSRLTLTSSVSQAAQEDSPHSDLQSTGATEKPS